MKELNKKRRKKRNRSFILTLALIAVLGYFVITLINLKIEIRDKKQVLNNVDNIYHSQQIKNKQYTQIIKDGENSQYIERVARDVLGYVLPGERVYCNTSTEK